MRPAAIALIGASVRIEPHTCGSNKNLSIYLYVYIWTCVFRIFILPYLCVMQYFYVIQIIASYMSQNIAKLATFESQKDVCATHIWNPKKERKAKA